MSMSQQEQRAAERADHPMREVVDSFQVAREACRHYRAIKTREDSRQCTHDHNHATGNWCAMDCCPLLIQRAKWVGIGWN